MTIDTDWRFKAEHYEKVAKGRSAMTRDFEMTAEDLATLLDACKPVPMIMLQCGTPLSPQENANAAWAALGAKMGFDPMTVRHNGKGDRFFTAAPVEVKP